MEDYIYNQRTVSGLTCLEEFGVYVYRKEGTRGSIYFTSMRGRRNSIHIDLDNYDPENQGREGWHIHTGCGTEGCVENNNWQYLCDNFNSLTFLIISWDWNTVDRGKPVQINGRGIGFQYIS